MPFDPNINDQSIRPVPMNRAEPITSPRWLHPLSILFDSLAHLRSVLVPLLFGGYAAFQGMKFGVVIATFIVLINIFFSVLRFVSIRYHLQGEDLIVDEGILFRKHRTIPVQRIQNIDLKQNVLHRIFKVAEVRIETASGKEPEAILRVISLDDVQELQSQVGSLRLLRRESSSVGEVKHSQPIDGYTDVGQVSDALAARTESGDTRELATKTLLSLSLKDLVLAGLLSNRGIVLFGVMFGLLFQFDWWDARDSVRRMLEGLWQSASWVVVIPAFFIGIVFVVKAFSIAWYVMRFYNYRLELTDDDLRIQCGLFTQLSATIPRRRIQLISVQQSVLQRFFKLATIRVETAGGAGKSEDASSSIGRRRFVPIIAEAKLPNVIEELRPGIVWKQELLDWKSLSPRAGKRLRRIGVLVAIAASLSVGITFRPWGGLILLVAIPLAIWYANKKAKSMRYARGENQVFFRSGVLDRKFSTTFLDKVQSFALQQSPLDRRWSMASLAVDTAGAGPANHRIVVRMLDADFAQAEFETLPSANTR